MTCGVYEIINKETNQLYIGRSLDIESRWKQHINQPSNNMVSTIELYEENPGKVEFNIIHKVDTHCFDNEELKFITSVCEFYEIEERKRQESDELLNAKNGNILPCPPTIISKKYHLPDYVTDEDILVGVEKWTNEVYRFRIEHNPHLQNKSRQVDPDSGIYWRKQYLEIKEKYENLEKNKQQKPSLSNYHEKMVVDYEYFKVKKDNQLLKDKCDELESKVNFWRDKCVSWRESFFSIFEPKSSLKENKEDINGINEDKETVGAIFNFNELFPE